MLVLEVNLAGDDNIRAALERVAASLAPAACSAAAAEAGADVVRQNFITLSRSRHRPGQRLNYYLQAADSVIRESADGDAYIRVPHTGIALRYHGGTVRPSGRPSAVTGRPVKRLAIGLKGTPAEGHVPADFPDLFVVLSKGARRGDPGGKGRAFLARNQGPDVQRLFILLSSVTQSADPSVLPPGRDILDAAAAAILDLYDAAMEKAL